MCQLHNTRYVCLCAAKASHSYRTCVKVPSSLPHLLRKGLQVSSMKWRCLLRVLCPVRRPITSLDCVLLQGKNPVFVERLGPEIHGAISVTAIFMALPRQNKYLTHPLINLMAPELFFFNFSTSCIQNVNNTGTKYVRIMKQTAFWRGKTESIHHV